MLSHVVAIMAPDRGWGWWEVGGQPTQKPYGGAQGEKGALRLCRHVHTHTGHDRLGAHCAGQHASWRSCLGPTPCAAGWTPFPVEQTRTISVTRRPSTPQRLPQGIASGGGSDGTNNRSTAIQICPTHATGCWHACCKAWAVSPCNAR